MTTKIIFTLEDYGDGLMTSRKVERVGNASNAEKLMVRILLDLTAIVLGKAEEGEKDDR